MTATAHPKRCVILGAGGHAGMLIDALRAQGDVEPYAVLDRSEPAAPAELLRVPIRGTDAFLPQLIAEGVTCFVVGVGAIGDNAPRQRLFEWARAQGLKPARVQHPSAICSIEASVGDGCQLLPGSIVNARAVLGINVIVNSGAIIEHDCRVGDHAHIATGARLAGSVCVGDGAHVGAGAVVRQGVRIGRNAVVGIGAAVIRDVPDGVTVAGVPARLLGEVR